MVKKPKYLDPDPDEDPAGTTVILPETQNREIVEILTDPDNIEMLTDLKTKEIPLMAILEAVGNNPLPSASKMVDPDNLDKKGIPQPIQNKLMLELIFNIKKNRISEDRKSRDEVIKGLFANRSEIAPEEGSGGFLSRLLSRDVL